MSLKTFATLFLIIGAYCSSYAQPDNPVFGLTGNTTISLGYAPITIMDLAFPVTSDIDLTIAAPEFAGAPLGASSLLFTKSDIWLNYSCANPVVASRHIEVHLTNGSIPDGFELRMDIAAPVGGGGTLGIQNLSTLVLSSSPQTIVSGIGTCFTGDGEGSGHNLTFTFHYLTGLFQDIESQTVNDIIITYTLVDD